MRSAQGHFQSRSEWILAIEALSSVLWRSQTLKRMGKPHQTLCKASHSGAEQHTNLESEIFVDGLYGWTICALKPGVLQDLPEPNPSSTQVTVRPSLFRNASLVGSHDGHERLNAGESHGRPIALRKSTVTRRRTRVKTRCEDSASGLAYSGSFVVYQSDGHDSDASAV